MRLKSLFALAFIFFIASSCHALEYLPLKPTFISSLGGDILNTRDVDHDGSLDIILASFKESSYAYILDNRSNLVWRNKISSIYPNDQPHIVDIADVDGDYVDDIIVFSHVPLGGSSIECDSSRVSKYFLFRLSRLEDPLRCNGRLACNFREWSSEVGFVLDFDLEDFEGDGNYEIVTGRRDFQVTLFRNDGSINWTYDTEGSVYDIEIADIDADGEKEILAGSYRMLHVLNKNGALQWTYNTADRIVKVTSVDSGVNGTHQIFLVTGDDKIISIDTNGEKLWETDLPVVRDTATSGIMDTYIGNQLFLAKQNAIYSYYLNGSVAWVFDTANMVYRIKAADLDGDGFDEILSLNKKGLTAYKLNPDYVTELKANDYKTYSTELFNNNNYTDSITQAQFCVDLYEQIGIEKDAEYCRTLVSESLSFMQADQYMLDLEKAYVDGDFEKVQNLSLLAYSFYLELNDTDQASIALDYTTRSSNQLNGIYYEQRAIQYYRGGGYEEGYQYAMKAAELYGQANDDESRLRAEKLANDSVVYKMSNTNLSDAYDFYNNDKIYRASDHARYAELGYLQVNDESKYLQAHELLLKVNDSIIRFEKTVKAQNLLTQADERFNESRYMDCKTKGEQARQLLVEAGDRGLDYVERAEYFIDFCSIGSNATKNYAIALEYFNEKNYDLAEDYALQARKQYRSIGDWQHSIMCDELTVSIHNELREIEKKERASKISQLVQDRIIYFLILFPLILLFIAILVFLFMERDEIRKIILEIQGKKVSKDFTYPFPLGGEIDIALGNDDIPETPVTPPEVDDLLVKQQEREKQAMEEALERLERQKEEDPLPQITREELEQKIEDDETIGEIDEIRKHLKKLGEKLDDE